jgi:hypothetical protein
VKIRISIYAKDFSWENEPHAPNFKAKKSKLSDFYDNFKKYKRIPFFSLSYIVCSKFWLN